MSAVKGRRKDFWLWTQRKHVEREYKDQPDKLWDWMKKTVPAKYAESFTRQIPLEIENTVMGEVAHTLNVILPEPRRVLPSNVKHLDVIAVDGCKADSTIDADDVITVPKPKTDRPSIERTQGHAEMVGERVDEVIAEHSPAGETPQVYQSSGVVDE